MLRAFAAPKHLYRAMSETLTCTGTQVQVSVAEERSLRVT
jgi:hypothetical protein